MLVLWLLEYRKTTSAGEKKTFAGTCSPAATKAWKYRFSGEFDAPQRLDVNALQPVTPVFLLSGKRSRLLPITSLVWYGGSSG